MNYVYFDAKAGLSGDMILGALLDLGIPRAAFKPGWPELGSPSKSRSKKSNGRTYAA